MKSIEEYLLDIIGYGEEAKIINFYRPHMIAVVSFVCRPGFCYEVIRFEDSDGLFISLESDIYDRELLPHGIYNGSYEDCMKLFNLYCSLPLKSPGTI